MTHSFSFHVPRSEFRVPARRGFTLAETLVVVGILALFGAAILTSFSSSRTQNELSTTSQNIISTLRLAQAKTLGGEENSAWGIHLEQGQYALFRGASFSGSPAIEPHPLPSSLEITGINLAGGGSEVLFKRISGATDQSGTFTLRARASASQSVSVSIDASGKVYLTEPPPSLAGTRLIDARHRGFALGWSIQNALALTLTFSDPPNSDTIQAVVMAPYFNAQKTEFDWSGAISVGGQNQVLRIHTTTLTGADTALSVDRDCRRNTKKLRVSIDTKDIATYEADCKAVTVGLFGGVMSEP